MTCCKLNYITVSVNTISQNTHTHTHSKRLHAITMVEKSTVQENLGFRDGGAVQSRAMLAPMTSDSSVRTLTDNDRYAAGSVL